MKVSWDRRNSDKSYFVLPKQYNALNLWYINLQILFAKTNFVQTVTNMKWNCLGYYKLSSITSRLMAFLPMLGKIIITCYRHGVIKKRWEKETCKIAVHCFNCTDSDHLKLRWVLSLQDHHFKPFSYDIFIYFHAL